MAREIIIAIFIALLTISCNSNKTEKVMTTKKDTTAECADGCKDSDTTVLACKMTTVELRKRKETVLLSLKNQITEKKELKNGYAFKFAGTDKMVDELAEFIKTERECCSFFTFNLSISGNKNSAWLELTGPNGAKEFITSELGL